MDKKANQKFAAKAQFDPFLYLMEIGMDPKQPQATRVAVAVELLPYLRTKVKHAPLQWPVGIPKNATPQEAAQAVLENVELGLLPPEQGLMMMTMIEKTAGFSFMAQMEEMQAAIAALQSPNGAAVNGPMPAWLRMKHAQQTHEGNSPDHPAE